MTTKNLLMTATGGAAATVSFLQSTTSATDTATYTFSSQSIGAADSDRTILVCVSARLLGSTAASVSSVTVGGVSATAVVQASNVITNANTASIFAIDASSGTTADVVVTMSRSALRCGIGMWRCTGISTTANDTATSTSVATLPGSVTTTSGGIAVGVSTTTGADAASAWTGITEDYDTDIGAEQASATGASDAFASAGAVSITCTPTNTTEAVAAYAAW